MPDPKDIKMQKQRFLPTKAHDQKGRKTDRKRHSHSSCNQVWQMAQEVWIGCRVQRGRGEDGRS